MHSLIIFFYIVVCVNIYGPQIFVGSAIIFVSPMCLIKLICICRLNTSSGRSRGGGGGSKNNVVLKMCFVNIYIQYSLTKYGFWSTLSIFLFPFSFHLGRGGHPPPCPTPARYFGSRTMSTYFYNFVVTTLFCQYLYTI